MKSFFGTTVSGDATGRIPAPVATPGAARPDSVTLSGGPADARIAVYDSLAAAPRVEDISAADLSEAVEALASRTYNLAREHGGTIPYTIIREVSENLVHASFTEVVVTILDDGNTIRFSDQGPGIPDKERVFLPGFSTATAEMKRHIKGVGSGLPIVRETLTFAGGSVEIEDNLGRGAVVTLRVQPKAQDPVDDIPALSHSDRPRLTTRQKRVLSIVVELGSAGPSVVARELSVGLSTAYRDLAALEECGLIESDESGKRSLSEAGLGCLDEVLR